QILVFEKKAHDRDWVGRRNWIVRLLITFNQKGEEFDGFFLGTRRASERSQSEENFSVCGEFSVIMNDVRRAFRDHFSWVSENGGHFAPNFLSQLAGFSYSLCVKNERI